MASVMYTGVDVMHMSSAEYSAYEHAREMAVRDFKSQATEEARFEADWGESPLQSWGWQKNRLTAYLAKRGLLPVSELDVWGSNRRIQIANGTPMPEIESGRA